MERSPIKKSWGEGVKIKKIIGRGVCQILKNMGRRGGGGATWLKKITSGVGYILYILKSRRSDVSKNPKRADACKFQSMKFRAGAL